MSSMLTMPVERPRLRIAIVSGDVLRKSALVALVAEAGHCLSETAEADVVVDDGTALVLHAEHRAVVLRLSDDLDDDPEVAGLLPTHATPEQILAAIAAVTAGLSVRRRDSGVEGFGAPPEPPLQSLLTPREIQVLSALAEGLSNKVIAHRLRISQHTVKFHVESLFRKLGVRSRSQAVAKGLASISL
jgi:DNA-binding CsgD family transcriptional regulator